ncbi:MAG: phytanoyl-CoA dioxygenase family protein [Pacificimonas sp.]|jgi:ectoine hydroxylase-related dioxygenase (phytanoyl-CoA dioxygenase family)|nr:phytanoyl-CoA dioxygenase family protein [Pacificimonas sp.]
MPSEISSIGDYRRDGVSVVRQVVPSALAQRLAEATDRALADPAPDAEIYEGSADKPLSYGELQVWKRIDGFEAAIREGGLARAAAAHMGSSRAQFFYDQLLVKEPGAAKRTPWHQDVPYWNVSGTQICSLWLALDPIPGTAALEFVRGSQDWAEHNPQHFADASPYEGTGLAALPDIDGNRAAYDIVSFDLQPGDAIIFHAAMVHGAPGIQGSGRRRAYSTRWLGDDAVFVSKPGERAFPAEDGSQWEGQPYSGADYPVIFQKDSPV